jgi:SAM-dependent methyltransferase
MSSHDAPEPWWRALFREDYLKHWISNPDYLSERTPGEVAFIWDVMGLAPGSRVLDLCCGQGRHAVPLAQRGCDVVGVDLSEELLAVARDTAQERGVPLTLARCDMRDVEFDAEFDAVINMFTAFGYFEDESENLRALRGVARALRPGGRFLLDLVNRDRLIRFFQERDWPQAPDGWLVIEERTWDARAGIVRAHVRMLGPEGVAREYDTTIRLYSYPEIRCLLEQAGLFIVADFGDFARGEFSRNSSRMILLSEKRTR